MRPRHRSDATPPVARPPALVLALGVLCVALALLMLPAPPAARAARAWAGGVVTAPGGPYLTDAQGRRLQLHGVNLVAKCGGGAVDLPQPGTPCVGPERGAQPAYVLSPSARDPGRRFTAADARTLVSLGVNVVRLGVIWEGLEPGPAGARADDPRYCARQPQGRPFPSLGRADPYDPATVRAYLARTGTIVGLLARAGIRVILDMHSDAWGSAFFQTQGVTPWQGDGAPLWATCTDHRRFVATPGWGDAYLSRPVQNAIHHFFANDVRGDLQGQFARVWQAVASHFRGNPDVLGYEVYNEPNDLVLRHFDPELQCDYGGAGHEPRSCRASRTRALPDGLIGAIQSADPTHVVFFEPSGATGFGTPETIGIAEPLRFGRLALAFHVYGVVPFQLHQTLVERSRTRTDQKGGPPWVMDEFGASNDAAASAATVSRAAGMNLSWVYWSAMQLHDPTGGDAFEGLIDQRTRLAYPPLAQALAVPYPWATAGRPGAQSFDRQTGTFRYAYAVDPRVAAPSEIELPPYTYPFGYTVAVSGARVLSRSDAPVLALRAQKGAKHVSVTVRSLIGFPFPRY